MAGVARNKDKGESSEAKVTGLVIECKDMKDWETHFGSRKKSKELVVVEFVANWVKNCKPFIPMVEKVAREYPEITFLKVDSDKLKIKAEDKYDVEELPALYFFKEGKEVKKIVGVLKTEVLDDKERQLKQAIELLK